MPEHEDHRRQGVALPYSPSLKTSNKHKNATTNFITTNIINTFHQLLIAQNKKPNLGQHHK